MDTQRIGRRIAYWRDRRRMTQADLGALMGKSRRFVQSLESGERQADPRLSVLESAARALSIPVTSLLADAPGTQCIDGVELDAIRTALLRHDMLTGTADESAVEPLPVEVLERRLVHARVAFQAGHFASLGRLVPELLIDANRAAARHTGEAQLGAFRYLSLTLELTEGAAVKYGDVDLALMSGHRAVAAAERSQDPVIMASAARHLADAMTMHGQTHAAAAFAVAAAGRLESDLRARGADGLSVLGMLYLKAAMAEATAAASDDTRAAASARAVPDLLDQADGHAEELGADGNAVWTAFGPTNTKLYRVAAHVQLSEGADAVAVAQGIPNPARAALPKERRAHLLGDLARGLTQAGQREEAVDTLLDAEREAEEEVRCRPRTRALVEDLRLLGAGQAEGRLRALAARCGLPE
ncbi:helix-turn-helix transcriptional regulator [Streptomyces sp. NBC_00078]|uniref:helix-turn-helix domain-containing protein n=1 Tax=Streptomyces sp. NBC_00078 TaxID=2975643 RepID=UPI002257BE4E|nr:helix-turn-helix transcriptional regulator [Streptomyces sp. NBC_00078]MCX5426089.1 helix-turn-helix domain-containing protein [Streptomyces sp. NBC_00078]